MCAHSRHIVDIDFVLVGPNAQSFENRIRHFQFDHLFQSIENPFAFVCFLEILLNLQMKRCIVCDQVDLPGEDMRNAIAIVLSHSSVSWRTGRDVVKVGHLRFSASIAFIRVCDTPLLVYYFDWRFDGPSRSL